MKKTTLTLLLTAIVATSSAFPTESLPTNSQAEKATKSTLKESQQQKQTIKKGWNVAPFPSIGYNSDIGFTIGALCELFHYGDGSTYPQYRHKFNIEASYSTGGQITAHLFYDSNYLIPKVRFTFASTYLLNTMYPFLGFNGSASPYNQLYDSNKEQGIAMYNIRRNMVRILADFQGNIYKERLRWAAGISFWHYNIEDISLKHYNVTNNSQLLTDNIHSGSLYQLYRRAGLIRDNEASGGSHIEFKAGLVFDNRDHEADPSNGIWAELYGYGSADIFHNRNHYLKLAAHYRHYIPIWNEKIVFAYHLAYQGTVAGEAPFYTLQNISTLYLRQIVSDGLGSINTIRGVRYNSVVGNGYAWANIEMRFRLVSFKFIKQNWYLATNPFFDIGACVQPYRLKEMQQICATKQSLDGSNTFSDQELALIYNGSKEKLHSSAGFGVKLVMNRNFILSAEFAFPLNQAQDGKFGTNIGLNYIF